MLRDSQSNFHRLDSIVDVERLFTAGHFDDERGTGRFFGPMPLALSWTVSLNASNQSFQTLVT